MNNNNHHQNNNKNNKNNNGQITALDDDFLAKIVENYNGMLLPRLQIHEEEEDEEYDDKT